VVLGIRPTEPVAQRLSCPSLCYHRQAPLLAQQMRLLRDAARSIEKEGDA